MIIRKNNIWEKIITLFFPKRCVFCDEVIADDGGICSKCIKKVKLLKKDVCMKCGQKIPDGKVYCYDCNRRAHEFERNFAVFEYPHVKESLYRFKYRGRAEYAAFYAKQAWHLHGKRLQELHADAIVPVPLHSGRMRKRGYNQAQEFGQELSKITGIPINNHFVKRIKATRPLKTLDNSGRQNNLKKAFLISENDVKLKTIILVDDIYTTATLDEIARVCKDSGVEKIYTLTIAVGNGL